jgi:hypothetical protein
MGFTNREANLQGILILIFFLFIDELLIVLALTATMGDVNAAVERLLAQI